MREHAGDRGNGESREQVVDRETDAERAITAARCAATKRPGREQAEAHWVTIGIREE